MQSYVRRASIVPGIRVARLMREQEIFAKRPRHRTVTTHSEKGAQVAPDLLQRDFRADEPNTTWVADTTSIWTAEGWLYLAVVLDVFSRMVVGWSMAAIQDANLVVQALHMALTGRRPQAGVLHHSDRGSPYTSESYQELLQQEGRRIRMSRPADCYDNTAMESFFHSFKGECVDGESFQTRTQASRAIVARPGGAELRASTSPPLSYATYWLATLLKRDGINVATCVSLV